MRFGSVCSGIEAASAAWNPLGWKAAWFAEIEPFPCAVLAHHYPDVLNYGDMTKLPARIASGEIEAPDVLCGGTPCQAFSVAGKRESLADARGNLSLTFCTIADTIDAARHIRGLPASIIFWENVPGVLSTKDNAFGCFLAQLCGGDEPLNAPDGWPNAGCVSGPSRTAAWRVLDAQYFGVAQRRRRVFVVASARDGFDPAGVLFEFDGLRRDSAPRREAGQGAAHDIAPSLTASGRGVERVGDTRGQDPVVAVGTLCVTTGQSGAEIAPTLNCNHEAPYIARPSSYSIRTANTGSNGWGLQEEITHTLDCAQGLAVAQPLPFDTAQITSKANGSNHKAGDPCHPLAARAHVPYIAKPTFAAAFKGGQGSAAGSIGYSEHVAPTLSSADSGSNRTPVVLTHIANGNSTPEVSTELAFPLRANDGSGNRQALAHATEHQAMQVRRLTARECERLQGFQFRVAPDYPSAWQDAPGEWWSPDYTLIPFGARKKISKSKFAYLRQTNPELRMEDAEKLAADGLRYKALGNSWAVPVVSWIGKRIKAAL